MAQKPALGKGLASLLPGAKLPGAITFTLDETVDPASAMGMGTGAVAAGPPVSVPLPTVHPDDGNRDRHPGISLVGVEEIKINPFQPRREFKESAIEELAQSIQANGLIQPIVVRKIADGYELIAGERRLRACKRLGLKQIPIVIKKVTDKESLEMALIENIQRQDLNCIETALAYFQLIEEFGLTQEEVARRVGKDRTSVANHLRLLRLPEEVVEDLKKGSLSFGHGRALLALQGQDLQSRARGVVAQKGLSVRETEALVEQMQIEAVRATEQRAGEKTTDSSLVISESAQILENRLINIAKTLSTHLSTKVELKGSEKRGKFIIHYKTREDLDRILERLQN